MEEDDDFEEATAQALAGRSYDEYAGGFIVGTLDETAERLKPMAETGIDYSIVYLLRVAYEPEPVRLFACDVIP